ncbi:hypothetical protein EJ063_07670 [Vibrio aquaticus]|uniref:Uncharacterized protein n=1 Tax=Vibrio aquaticus TaxID=2496559 RepID=A0A432CXU0_9VIBR|nr:hypothetical protein [Vibrio aquaticus]RTZ16662.1 hypothetical protein EJ063_07670 [Vibrio aquaticus]
MSALISQYPSVLTQAIPTVGAKKTDVSPLIEAESLFIEADGHLNVEPKNIETHISSLSKAHQSQTDGLVSMMSVMKSQSQPSGGMGIMSTPSQQPSGMSILSSPSQTSGGMGIMSSTTLAEYDIAKKLADSVMDQSQLVSDISAWTQGGSAVINPMLDIMLDDLLATPSLTQTEYEDIMQLMILDMAHNEAAWGLDIGGMLGLTDAQLEKYTGNITENFGSGAHAKYQGIGSESPEDIINWFLDDLVHTLSSEVGGKIAVDSVTAQVIDFFSSSTANSNALRVAGTNYLDTSGDVNLSIPNVSFSEQGAAVEKISPVHKLYILAGAAAEGISEDEWSGLLTNDAAYIENLLSVADGELDAYIVAKFPHGGSSSPGWSFDTGGQLDFNQGANAGIKSSHLVLHFENFPSRELTEDEIAELNRVGDATKVIQQTLKYWLQIMKDQRLASSRNI